MTKRSKKETAQATFDFNRADAEAALLALQLRSIWVAESKSRVRVSGKTLKAVLMRICSYQWTSGSCWASAKTIAGVLNCHERTVRRACAGLVTLRLLVVLNQSPGKTVRYSIDWGEVAAFNRRPDHGHIVADPGHLPHQNPGHSDANPGHSDANPGHSDANPGHSDTNPGHNVRRTLLTSTEPLLSTGTPTSPERSSAPPAPIGGPDPWEVVVSVLLGLEMSERGTALAVTAGKDRELTADDVHRLIERWERLRARQRNVTIGWLYRWMIGDESPPPERHAPTIRSVSIMSETTRWEMVRSRIVRAGRQAGRSEADIEQRVEEARQHFHRSKNATILNKPPPDPARDQNQSAQRRRAIGQAIDAVR